MELPIAILVGIVLFLGGGVTGWVIKPPVKQTTEIKTEIRIDVQAVSESKGYSVLSTEVYNFPEKVFGLVLSNTNFVTNLVHSILTNTNYYRSTTNTSIEAP